MGVKVLVLVSPIPECDSQRDVYGELTPHLDGELSTLPVGLFNDSDRHYTLDGAGVVSGIVARKILALEAH
jgi:tRNA isopentenyl-2-thiomethyl-A-37 hydroxylase MiaE